MCAAIDNKTKGFQKFFNIFSRSKASPLSRRSSNHNEIDSLQTDAIAITQPDRKSSLQTQQMQIQQNASMPVDLINSPNFPLYLQHHANRGGTNVNNNFHISGSDTVHIGNNIQIIQNNSKTVTKNSPEKATKSSASMENGLNVERSKRFLGEQKRIVEKLKKSTTEITDEIITTASDNISPINSNFLYRYLGISDAKIDMIDKDNFTLHGSREVIYKMLLHWKQCADKPTIGLLITALYKNKNDQCINELIRHFTENGTLSDYIKDQ